MFVRKAKMQLDDIVSQGNVTPLSYHESTNGQSSTGHEIMIPAAKTGLVTGKRGEAIQQLQVHSFVVAVTSSRWILNKA